MYDYTSTQTYKKILANCLACRWSIIVAEADDSYGITRLAQDHVDKTMHEVVIESHVSTSYAPAKPELVEPSEVAPEYAQAHEANPS